MLHLDGAFIMTANFSSVPIDSRPPRECTAPPYLIKGRCLLLIAFRKRTVMVGERRRGRVDSSSFSQHYGGHNRTLRRADNASHVMILIRFIREREPLGSTTTPTPANSSAAKIDPHRSDFNDDPKKEITLP